LILSIFLIGTFAAWQYYLQYYTTFPPLMKLSILARGSGKMTAINMIAFFEVFYPILSFDRNVTELRSLCKVEWIPSLGVMGNIVLSTVREPVPDNDHDSVLAYDDNGYYMLFHSWISCGQSAVALSHW
jgi:hypothetical protein